MRNGLRQSPACAAGSNFLLVNGMLSDAGSADLYSTVDLVRNEVLRGRQLSFSPANMRHAHTAVQCLAASREGCGLLSCACTVAPDRTAFTPMSGMWCQTITASQPH